MNSVPSKKLIHKELIHHVNISGLGCDAFQQSLLNVYLWDIRMSHQFDANMWTSWSSVERKEYPTVQFSNRILTPSFLCEDVEQMVLPGDKGKAVKNLVDEGMHKYISDNEIGLYKHMKNGKINK